MEESEVATTQKEAVDNVCVKDAAEEQVNEATGDVSSQMSVSKPSEEPKTRYNRLKLFDKVMQKSLEKFVEHAR